MNRGQGNGYITPINVALAAVMAAVYVVLELLGDTQGGAFMCAHGAMHPYAVLLCGEWYRLLTSAFVHFGFSHLVNNLVLLICLGSYLERALGKVRFCLLYVLCAVGSSAISLGWMLYKQDVAVSGGASGVVFGMIGALLLLLLKGRGRFADFSLRRFLLMMALSLYYGFSTTGVDNAAHVGGLIVGFVLCAIFQLPSFFRRRRRGLL